MLARLLTRSPVSHSVPKAEHIGERSELSYEASTGPIGLQEGELDGEWVGD